MLTNPSPSTPARTQARTQRLLLLAQTMTLAEMGRYEGISRERVRQILNAAGFSRRNAFHPCISCGGPARRTYCAAASCKTARQRAACAASSLKQGRPPAPRAVCAHCQTTLKRPVRTDGKPSFCADKLACRSAREHWRYHNDPRHRAYLRHYARSERARAAARRSRDRYLAATRGVEYLSQRSERQRLSLAKRRAHQARIHATQCKRDARAAARESALADRAAVKAAALLRVEKAIHLSQSEHLSQRAIASQLGVSRSIVHAWLHGQRAARALYATPGDPLPSAA